MKLLIVSANFVPFEFFISDHQFLFCFVNIFLKMWRKKSLQSGRGGLVGYSKHTFFA